MATPRLLKAGLLLPTAAAAQTPVEPVEPVDPVAPPLAEPPSGGLQVGPVFGLTASRLVVPRLGGEYSLTSGFTGDYLVRLAVGAHLQVEQKKATARSGRPHFFAMELLYAEYGSRFSYSSFVSQQLSLPILFRVDYPLPGAKVRPSLIYGPEVSFKIFEGISYGFYSYSIGDYSVLPVDIGFNVGFGVAMPVGTSDVAVHLRFYQGFVPLSAELPVLYSHVGLFGGWYF